MTPKFSAQTDHATVGRFRSPASRQTLCQTQAVHFGRGRRSKRELRSGPQPSTVPGRLPRVAKLLALAIRFEQLIADGVVGDYAELARLGHVTRARITQIMNLLNLAPDIQEEILFLPRVDEGRDPVTERDLRPLVQEMNWKKQRQLWRQMALIADPA